jgi:hypothetical protein
MKARKRWAVVLAAALPLFFARGVGAQSPEQGQNHSQMSGMDMSQMRHDETEHPDAARAATDSMSSMHMDMSPHMYMTALRPENPNDEKRAAAILKVLRGSIEKYADYHAAIADGYQIYLPDVPLPQYHFTNWRYAYEAEIAFNPAHPTSLLYKRAPNGYELVGAMYTAPQNDTEDQLNERVPLSVARWHKHINICMPRKMQPPGQTDWKKFGLGGSILTQDACEAAGGRWIPQVFNWMVHVYPYETSAEKIWAH